MDCISISMYFLEKVGILMIVNEEQLSSSKVFNILDNSTFLLENEMDPLNYSPILENSNLGMNILSYRNLEEVSNIYGIDCNSAINIIAEQNNVDPSSICISVDQGEAIVYPEILSEFSNSYILEKLPDDNPEVQLCNSVIEQAFENEDVDIISVLEDTNITSLNELFDNVSRTQYSIARKQILARKKRHMNDYQSGHKRFGHASWVNGDRQISRNATEPMIRNLIKMNNANRPKPQPTPSPKPTPQPIPTPQTPSTSGNSIKSNILNRLNGIGSNMKSYGRQGLNFLNKNKNSGIAMAGIGAAAYAGAKGAKQLANYKLKKLAINRISALGNKVVELERQKSMVAPARKSFIQRMIDKIKETIRKLKIKLFGSGNTPVMNQ